MKGFIGLDFETYGDVDLTVHGLQRYTESPHFQPLIAAVVWVKGTVTQHFEGQLFDFVEDYTEQRLRLIEVIGTNTIVAHNAGFEQAVLASMDIHLPSSRFVDSAVLARAAGAAGKLEAAGPQLLGIDKMASGWELIKLFSIPKEGQIAFDPQIRVDHKDKWEEFAHYCAIDAELSLRLAGLLLPATSYKELANNAVTMDMNNVGWHVDVDLVRNMQLRYLINVSNIEAEFRQACGADELNLNSHTQLTQWCRERGVRASSFDEAHVAKLLASINKRLVSMTPQSRQWSHYHQVKHLLETKQAMGGSSLKKLQTILDTVGADQRLHDSYLHIGAGATFRTTGRGVQMQNLKRLNGEGDDMSALWVDDVEWDNSKLATNLRQVFTATDPKGQLIVGDFSSVESRGLAWQSGEDWKLNAYAQGRPVYEEQAGLIFGIDPSQVTKPQRQVGKVGELSCGYGAGADAVKDFAEKMGVVLSEVESAMLVRDWRAANPKTVEYWYALDDALHKALTMRAPMKVDIPHGRVMIDPAAAPESLSMQVGNPNLLSLRVRLLLHDNTLVLTRVIHGVHEVGRNIHYWKPSERKTGNLWTDTWMNPKTKRQQPFTIYGGKLAGLLTQSLCREVFFDSLRQVHAECAKWNNVSLVGQMHDEIVLDWVPGALSLADARAMLEQCMTNTQLPGFPLAAEMKHDYRYTK